MLLRSRSKRTRPKKSPITSQTNLVKPKIRKNPPKRDIAEQPSMEFFLSPRSELRTASVFKSNKQRVSGLDVNLSSSPTTSHLLAEPAVGNTSPLEEIDRRRNIFNASLDVNPNNDNDNDKEERGDKPPGGTIPQKSGTDCLITAHVLLLLLEKIYALDNKLHTFLQKVNQFMSSQDLVYPGRASQDPSDKSLLESAPGPLLDAKGRGATERVEQENLQLLLLPSDIVLNFPSSDTRWWSNGSRIAKSLSLILKRNIRMDEIQKFFFLPSIPALSDSHGILVNEPCKRLYISFVTARTPKEIIKQRLILESWNIYPQRTFRQINIPAAIPISAGFNKKSPAPSLIEQHTNEHLQCDCCTIPLNTKSDQQNLSKDRIMDSDILFDDKYDGAMLQTNKIQPDFTPAPPALDPDHTAPSNEEMVALNPDSYHQSKHPLESKNKSPENLIQKRDAWKKVLSGNSVIYPSPLPDIEPPPDIRPGALFKNDPHFTRLMEVLFPEEFASVQNIQEQQGSTDLQTPTLLDPELEITQTPLPVGHSYSL